MEAAPCLQDRRDLKKQVVKNPHVQDRVVSHDLANESTVIKSELADLLDRQSWKRTANATNGALPRHVPQEDRIAFAAQVMSSRVSHDLAIARLHLRIADSCAECLGGVGSGK